MGGASKGRQRAGVGGALSRRCRAQLGGGSGEPFKLNAAQNQMRVAESAVLLRCASAGDGRCMHGGKGQPMAGRCQGSAEGGGGLAALQVSGSNLNSLWFGFEN